MIQTRQICSGDQVACLLSGWFPMPPGFFLGEFFRIYYHVWHQKSLSDLAIYLLPNRGASKEGVKNKKRKFKLQKNKRRDIGSEISRLELLGARILTNLNAVVFSFPISFHKFSKTEARKSTVKPQKQCSRNAKVLGRAIPCLQLAGLSLFVEINVSGSLLAEASKHRIPLINPSCSFSHTYQVSFQAGFHSLVGLPSWIHTVHNDLNIPGFLTFTFFIINWVIWLLENVVQASELH